MMTTLLSTFPPFGQRPSRAPVTLHCEPPEDPPCEPVAARRDYDGTYRFEAMPAMADLPPILQISLGALGVDRLDSLVSNPRGDLPLSDLRVRPDHDGAVHVTARYGGGQLEHRVEVSRRGKDQTISCHAADSRQLSRLRPAWEKLCARHLDSVRSEGLQGWLAEGPPLENLRLEANPFRCSASGRSADGCERTWQRDASGERSSVTLDCPDVAALDRAAPGLLPSAVDAAGYFHQVFDGASVQPVALHVSTDQSVRGASTRLDFQLRDGEGSSVGNMCREFNRPREGEPSVHHDYFKLNVANQGHDLAKQIFARSIPFYESQGFHRVDVYAALTVGGYAWAKYGFVPESREEMRELSHSLEDRMDELALDPEVRRSVRGLLRSGDPKNLWAIADLQVPVEFHGKKTTLGKALLLTQKWSGQLDLSDPEAQERFQSYVTKESAR